MSSTLSIALVCVALASPPFDFDDVRSIANMRDEIRTTSKNNQPIALELVDGERLGGSIGKMSWRTFEIVDRKSGVVRKVSYRQVRAFLDPATGQTIATRRQTWLDRRPGRFVGLAAAATGVLVIIYVATHIPRT
jgi:hypothetical protein